VWADLLAQSSSPERLSDLVLIVVASDSSGVLRLVLQRCGVGPSQIVAMLEERVLSDEPQAGGPTLTELFNIASEAAANLKSPAVMPHHLLLALLEDGRSPLVATFSQHNVTAEAVRQAIRDLEKP
jgi:ATP-dependent Clp protease ATP-binding subunit ClpA